MRKGLKNVAVKLLSDLRPEFVSKLARVSKRGAGVMEYPAGKTASRQGEWP
jgi:hypothetical protein